MRINVVSPEHWRSFFDIVSKEVEDHPVELEFASLATGDQIEDSWTTLWGLSYDPRADVLTIQTDSFDRWILAPHQVYIREGAGQIEEIGIRDIRGQVLLIRFWRLQALPPAPEALQRKW